MSKQCILVVDDHPETLRLISIILERNGFKALTATSGAEGISKTQAEHPDLILMDIMMPQMTGVDACRALRQDDDPRVANSTIVMFSASANPADREDSEAAKADGFIVKPTKPRILIEMVNRFLANPHQQSKTNEKVESEPETKMIGVIGKYASQLTTSLSSGTKTGSVVDYRESTDNLPTDLTDIIITLSYSLTSVSKGKAMIEQLKANIPSDTNLHVVLVNTGEPVSATEDMVGQLIEYPVLCTVALNNIDNEAKNVIDQLASA